MSLHHEINCEWAVKKAREKKFDVSEVRMLRVGWTLEAGQTKERTNQRDHKSRSNIQESAGKYVKMVQTCNGKRRICEQGGFRSK